MPPVNSSSQLKRLADEFELAATAAKRNRKFEDPHLSTEVPPGSPTDGNRMGDELDELDSDPDISEFIRRKKAEEIFYDEDGSFDFPSENRRDPAAPSTYESCIKFADELPSEKAAREAQEAEDALNSNINSEPEKPSKPKRGRPRGTGHKSAPKSLGTHKRMTRSVTQEKAKSEPKSNAKAEAKKAKGKQSTVSKN